MLFKSALALVNHLLAGEVWAQDRLAGFAGKSARLQFGDHGAFLVRITESGLLEMAEPGVAETVTIALPDDAPARWLTDRASLFSSATIAGSAELAEVLGFVVRNLRWDMEHDLSQLLGDVAARRGLRFAGSLARWQAVSARKFALGVADYLTEEERVIASRRDVESFCLDVDALRDDFARFEKWLQRVEGAA